MEHVAIGQPGILNLPVVEAQPVGAAQIRYLPPGVAPVQPRMAPGNGVVVHHDVIGRIASQGHDGSGQGELCNSLGCSDDQPGRCGQGHHNRLTPLLGKVLRFRLQVRRRMAIRPDPVRHRGQVADRERPDLHEGPVNKRVLHLDLELYTVDPGAVAAAQVEDTAALFIRQDAGVKARDCRIFQPHVVPRRTSQAGSCVQERMLLGGSLTLERKTAEEHDLHPQ
ncbi:MAG: hypothetical protein BWY79_00388 [Actinobacteria bacterium ADurb.Bin444]|nr:MAG: hypothetical protein BWY79_00388 [Actinobacteria bacterium ADurb.Bin444]